MNTQIDITLWIAYGVSVAFAIAFTLLYIKVHTKWVKSMMENISLSTELNLIKTNKIGGNTTTSVPLAFKEAMSKMANIAMELMKSFRDSNSFLLEFSSDVFHSNNGIDNNAKGAYMVDLIHNRSEISRFTRNMFNLTQEQPEFTNREINDESTEVHAKAKLSAEYLGKLAELGDKYCLRFIGYIKAAEDRDMMISDARLAVMISEFSTYLTEAEELNCIGEGQEERLSELRESLKKMTTLTDIIDSHLSRTPEECNDFDFEPFPREEDDNNSNHNTQFNKSVIDKVGGRMVEVNQPAGKVKDFNLLMKNMEQVKKVAQYITSEEIPAHLQYIKEMKKAGNKFMEDSSNENYLDFVKKAVDNIPVITNISQYAMWYKYYIVTKGNNQKNNASMNHENAAIRIMYMAETKLQTLFSDFEKSELSKEDKEAVETIKSVIQS